MGLGYGIHSCEYCMAHGLSIFTLMYISKQVSASNPPQKPDSWSDHDFLEWKMLSIKSISNTFEI
jgi:hypothetical protein